MTREEKRLALIKLLLARMPLGFALEIITEIRQAQILDDNLLYGIGNTLQSYIAVDNILSEVESDTEEFVEVVESHPKWIDDIPY